MSINLFNLIFKNFKKFILKIYLFNCNRKKLKFKIKLYNIFIRINLNNKNEQCKKKNKFIKK